jgi:GNAT superfamily N-acetyltransferase
MSSAELTIVPVTPERWADLEDLFRHGGDSAGCWCAWFRMSNKGFGAARVAGRQGALHELVETDGRPGLLAYSDGRAVGWVSIVPRRTLERIEPPERVEPPPVEDRGGVWAITCYVVRHGHRRSGVASALLDAAIEHARAAGATILEAYPVELPRSASSAFPGVVSMYLRRGFREVGRFQRWADAPAASGPAPRPLSRPGRPVMRLDLR